MNASRVSRLALLATLSSFTCGFAKADVIGAFDLTWSGASFGNGASATGQIVLDLTTIPNPGSYGNASVLAPWIQSISITVSGAPTGDGTFTTSDFSGNTWSTNGGTFNFTQNLVGQTAGIGSWDTPNGSYGDFNFFTTNASAPNGSGNFTFATSDGNGVALVLTSFTPADVPEPASIGFLAVAMAALGFAWRRRSA